MGRMTTKCRADLASADDALKSMADNLDASIPDLRFKSLSCSDFMPTATQPRLKILSISLGKDFELC